MKYSQQLEKKLSELIPQKHFLATGFSRNSIYLLVKAHGWKNDDEIIIPAFTCPVIPKTVEESGLIPVSVDSENNCINIDPELIQEAINEKTRAIYVVHTYGVPAKIDEIVKIAKKYNLIVIEDVAHSLFSKYKGKQLGTFGDYSILSFTKKNINFEGGAIGTNNSEIFKKMLILQDKLNLHRQVSVDSCLDNYVRLLGSWWESGFTLTALILMKFNDFFNDILYKGGYGIKVDQTMFHPNQFSCKLTLNQLDQMQPEKSTIKFTDFKKFFSNIILISNIKKSNNNTVPAYYTGIAKKHTALLKCLSFRTWHNVNTEGKYPRADYLYSNYRIFSKIIMLFK